MKAWLRSTCMLLWLVLLACLPAQADTMPSLYKSFRGNVNFTGTEATLRSASNNSYTYYQGYGYVSNACNLIRSGVASAVLKGIPSGAYVESAQLYWAASGSYVDSMVTMDSTQYTASRTYQSATVGGGLNYFSAAVDVTNAVRQKGNGTYTFSGLSVNTGSPWCDSQAVVGGFALVVVYSLSTEPFRMLNIYEGFQYFQGNGFTLNLGNFNVPDLAATGATGRIGHITWEGDPTLAGGGETLLFNGKELTDSMNPSGNQFNSQSNVIGDAYSYGVDFDVYTLSAGNGTITSGQNNASTTYQTGQDLVLLSAEVVAMPYVANADLALTMTRSGDLTVNSTASYAITVTNQGLDTELGPVTVVDTLPSGLSYVSAAGSGWTCASAAGSNGATIVTCSHDGPLGPSATMTTLVLTVASSATANYNNSATVSGRTGDNNSANNTVSNTYTMPVSPTYGYQAAFTTEPCKVNDPIVVLASDKGCHKFIGPVIAGDTKTVIYITGVTVRDGVQYATALPTNGSSTSVSIDFATSCLPNSNVSISYAGLTNLDCKGTSRTANVTVAGNQATVSNVSSFFYADVGRVTLTASYQGTQVGSVTFISKPYDIRVRAALRDAGTTNEYPDQGGDKSTSFKKADIAFVRAGEPFTLRLGGWMANGAWAPSFGAEQAALAGAMDANLLTFKFGLDKFTVTSPQLLPVTAQSQKIKIPGQTDPVGLDVLVQNAFVINRNFAPSSLVTGAFDANVAWFEAGNLALVPSLENYLGAGQVPDAKNKTSLVRLGPDSATRVIGRFYPDHFATDVTYAFDCLAAMNCPGPMYDSAKATWPISGAVYSNQPFVATVNAYAMPAADGSAPLLRLFQNVPPPSLGARTTVNLTAVPSPNGSGILMSGSKQPVTFSPQALPYYPASGAFPDQVVNLSASATMTMPLVFDASNRLGTGWGAPTLFYVRASMNETRQVAPGDASQTFAVSSIAPAAAAAGTQYEDGLLAVTGRLQVANALGAETLRLPVGLTAQYWNGTKWLTNTNDNSSIVGTVVPAATPAPACTGALAASGTTCKSGVVTTVSGAAGIVLNKGRATMILQQLPPGRLSGNIDYQVGGDAAAYLPSTRARATFGRYKAPVIYLREVY